MSEANVRAHELAGYFPLMTSEELEMLADDIRLNGLRDKIELYEGEIIDGRNRCKACRKAGVEPEFVDVTEKLKGKHLGSYVLSKNLNRRHLPDPDQRKAIAVAILSSNYYRLRHIQYLVDHGKEVDTPPFEEILLQACNEQPPTEGDEVEEAAEALQVSPSGLKRRLALSKKAVPAVLDAVDSGELSMNKAEKIAKLPMDEQVAAIAGPPPEPEPEKDKRGVVLPENLKEPFASGKKEINSLIRAINAILKKVSEVTDISGCTVVPVQPITIHLKDAKTALSAAIPSFVCTCKGKGCEICHEKGWLHRHCGVVFEKEGE